MAVGRDGKRVSSPAAQLRFQPERHKDAAAVLLVAPERPTIAETNASVERVRGREGRVVAGLEEQLPVAALAGYLQDVIEQGPAHSASAQSLRSPHRLHFTPRWSEFFQCRAPEQHVIVPRGPEDNSWLAKPGGVEGKHVFRRSYLMHVPQVLLEKRKHLRPGHVVDFDSHRD